MSTGSMSSQSMFSGYGSSQLSDAQEATAKTIAIMSTAPILLGVVLAKWGGRGSLPQLGLFFWALGILMQLYAGYLRFVKPSILQLSETEVERPQELGRVGEAGQATGWPDQPAAEAGSF